MDFNKLDVLDFLNACPMKNILDFYFKRQLPFGVSVVYSGNDFLLDTIPDDDDNIRLAIDEATIPTVTYILERLGNHFDKNILAGDRILVKKMELELVFTAPLNGAKDLILS